MSAPKTKAGTRQLPIPDDLAPLLAAHLERWAQDGDDGIVFPSSSGRIMEGSTFRTTVWTKAIATAGIRHVVFHGLRVTSTTWLLDAGVNAKTVSVMQGHSSAAVTMNVYARSSAAARKSAAGKVGALLGEALAAAPNVVLIDSRRRDRQNVTRGRAGAGTETALSS